MFSHHSLIQSRTNRHQNSTTNFHRLLATTTNLNQRNNFNKQNQPELSRTCVQLSTLNFEQIFTIFLFILIFALFVFVCLLLYFCVLFCFSFASMILQSSLQFLLLDLKMSQFKFHILEKFDKNEAPHLYNIICERKVR